VDFRRLSYLAGGDHVLEARVLVDTQADDVVAMLQVKSLRACGQVKNDSGSRGVVDNRRAVVDVEQVVTAVEAPIAVDVA